MARRDEILADCPVIPHRGTYGVPNLRYGANFGLVLKDLQNPRFRKIVERKFGVDLSKGVPTMVMMGSTTGHYNKGYAHPDSKHKLFTVLVGFTREYPYERGRLRILRSNNRDDYAFEYPPEYGRCACSRSRRNPGTASCHRRANARACSSAGSTRRLTRGDLHAPRAERLGQGDPGFNKLLEYVPRNWKKVLTRH